MSVNKTQPTRRSVASFLASIKDRERREDSQKILKIMESVTGEKPVLWGSSIIGFGKYEYKYASGRQGTWFLAGFSPRKDSLTIYLTYGFESDPLAKRLGKFKSGKACLYIKSLVDINVEVLKKLISKSAKFKKIC